MQYSKGQQLTLKVSEVAPRMVSGQQKTFVGKDGTRYVFDINFENGFTAEFTSPAPTQEIFVPGRLIEFKIVGQNQHGTTIEPLVRDHDVPVNTNHSSMSGHPAVFAMGFAKDLAPHNEWDLNETLEAADKILIWLKDHR